jgi:DNA integrity scanning protein DisA with diadenylate cyclase activity
LLPIFKAKSAPLHDGAVIIFNDKISDAGCLLPLSFTKLLELKEIINSSGESLK